MTTRGRGESARTFRVFRVFRGYSLWLAWTLVVAACLALTACQPSASDRPDLAGAAEATRIAQATQDEAAQRAIERDILAARADKARAEAEAAYRAIPAAAVRDILIYLGIGLGVLVLIVGSAFAAVAWLNKRATAIYPNAAGQYPVMVSRGFGWVTYHDPSRGLGAGAVYRTPTLLDALAGGLSRLRGWPVQPPALTAEYPPNGSEPAMAQVAGQAQAIGLMAAATRPASRMGGAQPPGPQARDLVQNTITAAGLAVGRMPAVRKVTDPGRNARFIDMLREEGDG